MSSKEMNSICFVIFLMFSMVESNDFCEQFVRNGHKIDYSYQHQDSDYRSDHKFFVVIDHKYWRIKYKALEDNFTDIELETQSETSDWFGKSYRLGFSLVRKLKLLNNSDQTITGLLRRNDNLIEWGVFNTNTQGLLQRAIRSERTTTVPLDYIDVENLKIGYYFIRSDKSELLILSTRHPKDGYILVKGCAFAITKTSLDEFVIKECKERNFFFDTVAVFTRYNSHLLLVQENRTIKYCTDTSCKSMETLVDCQTETSPEDYSFIYILVGCLAVVVIIGLVLFAIYCCYRRGMSNTEKSPKKTNKK